MRIYNFSRDIHHALLWAKPDLTLARSCDVNGHVTIRIAVGHFLLMLLCYQAPIFNGSRDRPYSTPNLVRTQTEAESTLRVRDIT